MKRIWPQNAWGQPRFLPFVTRWLTRRAHRRLAEANRRGWDEGFTRAAAHLQGLTHDDLRELTCGDAP